MSFTNPPLYIEGGQHTGEELRAQIQDAARRSQGVTHPTDMAVTAMSAPTGQVQIAKGNCTIVGVADPQQGSYYCIAPDVTVVNIGPTGGSARSDLIVARVEDPQYEGSKTPSTAYYPYVITNVGSSATDAPAGITGIPLARIDIPASTAAITNAMITDLRDLTTPRRVREIVVVQPSGDHKVTAGSFTDWVSLGAIGIPSWATKVKFVCHIGSTALEVANFVGQARVNIPGVGASQAAIMNENWGTSGGIHRFGTVLGGTLAVPSGARGSKPTWQLQGERTSGTGDVNADDGSTIVLDYEFVEGVE